MARAAFPKGNAYLRVYDTLGPIYSNPQFAELFPNDVCWPRSTSVRAMASVRASVCDGKDSSQCADVLLGQHSPPAPSLSGPFTTLGDWEVLRIESLPHCISSHGDAAWWQEHFQEAPIVRDDGGNVQLTGEFLTWIEGELSQDPGFFDGYR